MKRLIYHHIFVYIGLLIVKIISSTYKTKVIKPEVELNVLKRGQVPIYASWHQRFFPALTFIAKRKPISVMISQSKDGELISRIVNQLGWHPVRGSSSRGGKKALKEVYRLAKKGCKIAHIVDGPRGPRGVVKPGLLIISKVSGMPIIPTIISAEKKWVFNSWDRFIVPKPFSRVIIRFGDEINVPNSLQGPAFEKKRSSIEDTLKKLYVETDSLWEVPSKIKEIF
ncbi:MAG: lysophospholipid acyltransferase family protein [Desulfobacterales bacterium]